ncbi:uncharacterized protein N7515_006552, partial [Penicillium bovifimosum]
MGQFPIQGSLAEWSKAIDSKSILFGGACSNHAAVDSFFPSSSLIVLETSLDSNRHVAGEEWFLFRLQECPYVTTSSRNGQRLFKTDAL